MKKLVVLASGSGSNFQAIIDGVQSGYVNATISGLIAGKRAIGAISKAEKHAIPFVEIPRTEFSDVGAFENALLKQLEIWSPDLIVLAGYLTKLPESVIRQFAGKIINIHPSLLPKFGGKGFYGLRVHEAVLQAGETESGCTVHWVDEGFDTGKIIAQSKVPVHKNDTPDSLASRILSEEHRILPFIIRQIILSS